MFSVLRKTSPKLIFGDSELHDSVELETFIPWYLCQVAEYDTVHQCLISTVLLVSSLDSLVSVCHYYQIEQIYLVSPASLNKSDTWKVDVLKSIHTATAFEDGVDRKILKYVLKDDDKLIYGLTESFESFEKIHFELLVDFQQLKERSGYKLKEN